MIRESWLSEVLVTVQIPFMSSSYRDLCSLHPKIWPWGIKGENVSFYPSLSPAVKSFIPFKGVLYSVVINRRTHRLGLTVNTCFLMSGFISCLYRKEHERCEFEVHEVYAVDVLISSGEGKVRQEGTWEVRVWSPWSVRCRCSHYTPRNEVRGGILESPCPSVRPHLGFRPITAFFLHLSSWNFTCRIPMRQGCAL